MIRWSAVLEAQSVHVSLFDGIVRVLETSLEVFEHSGVWLYPKGVYVSG